MTDEDWYDCLGKLDEHERYIVALKPDQPNPTALRCNHSRHRTLAHLRACQECWLEAMIAFQQRSNPRLKMLHPWRTFDQRSNPRLKMLHPWRAFDKGGYESVLWDDHLTVYLADRKRLREFLKTADRHRGGKINANKHTIEGLVSRIASHEHQHLFKPR